MCRPRPQCTAAGPLPALWYEFEGDIRNSGSSVVGDAVVTGTLAFETGMDGAALRLAPDASFTIPGWAAVVENATALTISMWVRLDSIGYRTVLECRHGRYPTGFDTYFPRAAMYALGTCAGGGGGDGRWAACTTQPNCLAVYTHYVMRWTAAGRFEVSTDGAPWRSSDGAPSDLFGTGISDLVVGSDGAAETATISIDDLRLYTSALSDADLAAGVTTCPPAP